MKKYSLFFILIAIIGAVSCHSHRDIIETESDAIVRAVYAIEDKDQITILQPSFLDRE